MKKLSLCLIPVLMLAIFMFASVGFAKAEEIVEPVDEIVEEAENTEEVKTLAPDELKAIIYDYVDKNVEDDNMKTIISWGISGVEAIALIVIYLLYRRGKSGNAESNKRDIKTILKDFLSDEFKAYSDEKLQPIVDTLTKVTNSTETMMKVLVLAQDKTAEGKIALIDYLGSATDNKEVKDTINTVKEVIKEEQEIKEKINEKVTGEYKPF